MALKVKNFYAKNTTPIAVVPAVAPFYEELNARITELITADVGSRADLTGYALSKSTKRKALETLCLKTSNAISSYAVVNNDTILQKRADFPSSKWYLCSEEELVTQASILKNLAIPIASDLVPFGASIADTTALGEALSNFTNAISDPTLAIDQRKEDNEKVLNLIDSIRSLLTDKIDVLMRSFEVNNPSLYTLYQLARAIDINGSFHSPTALVTVQPNTIQTIHTAAMYTPSTLYTLQNTGSEPVWFSLSATEGDMSDEQVLLAVGDTRSRLAENLSADGIYLLARNDSAVAVSVRIWVE
ncbi:MAG: hypothetical protein E6Q36_07910 [Chryseobacterium sp.]|nr:MAG: hypothetical protein E6Q36_07910 [Chryseobacterium sp.]